MSDLIGERVVASLANLRLGDLRVTGVVTAIDGDGITAKATIRLDEPIHNRQVVTVDIADVKPLSAPLVLDANDARIILRWLSLVEDELYTEGDEDGLIARLRAVAESEH